jgi:hypothetical protein
MNAQRPASHVPEEREAKHQRATSDVRGIRPPLLENWRHADLCLLIPRIREAKSSNHWTLPHLIIQRLLQQAPKAGYCPHTQGSNK